MPYSLPFTFFWSTLISLDARTSNRTYSRFYFYLFDTFVYPIFKLQPLINKLLLISIFFLGNFVPNPAFFLEKKENPNFLFSACFFRRWKSEASSCSSSNGLLELDIIWRLFSSESKLCTKYPFLKKKKIKPSEDH